MGIIVHPKFWGNAFAAEAHLAVLDHSFTVLGLHRIEFLTDSSEVNPMRLFFDRFGIKFEGVKRDCLVVPARDKKGKFYKDGRKVF